MKKKESKDQSKKISIQLDPKTSMFFGQLVNEGLAKFEVDPNLSEGEVRAAIEKGPGGGKLIVHAQSYFVFLVDDDEK